MTQDAATDTTPPPIPRIIEALLFAGGQPITAQLACAAIRGLTVEQFRDAIEELNRIYRRQNRPYTVSGGKKGFTLALKPAFRQLKKRFDGAPRTVRLSQPTLDVLAIVAYQQPVGRKKIDSLCQKDSSASLRQLVRLGLITIESGETASDSLYSTTQQFLTMMGVKSLDDMPKTASWRKV